MNAKSLTLEQLADFPYVYFDQGEDAPIAFYEEALSPGAARQEGGLH